MRMLSDRHGVCFAYSRRFRADSMKYLTAALLFLSLGNAPTFAADHVPLGLENEAAPRQNRIASGSIDAADLGRLRAAGVRHVINLRTEEEARGFDEAQIASGLGIDYHSIPIKGAESLTPENVRKLDEALKQAGEELTLVYCASSNRVGALIALREAWIGGQSTEAAIAEGKRWGLKGLEGNVRTLLEKGQ
jgi:uncharacterized protein (TIGR01244 family)